jgi:hypothetical protein
VAGYQLPVSKCGDALVIVKGYDLAVGAFICDQLGVSLEDMHPFTAMGVALDGKLVAGVLYNNFRKHDIQLTAAATDIRWLSKELLTEIFSYPYVQLGCVRTTAVTGRKNARTRKLLEGLGYRLEGVCRKGLDGKQDACVYGMLKADCKWLNLKAETYEKSAIGTRPHTNSASPRAGE